MEAVRSELSVALGAAVLNGRGNFPREPKFLGVGGSVEQRCEGWSFHLYPPLEASPLLVFISTSYDIRGLLL